MFSEITFSEEKTINSIKRKEKTRFSLTNKRLGDKVFMKRRKITEMITDVNATSVKLGFIFSFFRSEDGRYLIKLLPSPIKLKVEIKVITEIRVVAIPTCSGVNNLALITQKKKPKKDITAVLNIR